MYFHFLQKYTGASSKRYQPVHLVFILLFNAFEEKFL